MAYDASNNQDTQPTVASSTPLDQGSGTSTPISQPQEQSAPTSSPISSGQSSVEASSTGPSINKKAPKASSGMFTNIQKYVQKNKPQSQKMSQAVQEDFGQRAGDIRQAAEQKQAQTQQQLDANKNVLDQQTQFAQQQVDDIMGGKPDIQQANIQRFQDLTRGNIQGLQGVQDVNLARENMRGQALENMARTARTEGGRKDLLRQTFGDGKEYTRGMAGLDQLILGGDDAARQGLIEGVGQQGQQIGQDLRGIQQGVREGIAGQQQRVGRFGEEISGIASGAESGLQTGLDTAYDQALAERAALFGEDSEMYKQALAASQGQLDLLGKIGEGNLGNFADYTRNILKSGSKRQYDDSNLMGYLDQMNEFQNTGTIKVPRTVRKLNGDTETVYDTYKGKDAVNYLKQGGALDINHYKERNEMEGIANRLNQIYGDTANQDLYGYDPIGAKQTRYSGDLYSVFKNIKDQYSGMGTSEEVMASNLARQFGGQSFEDLTSGADLQRLDVASQEDIDKINALNNLLGRQGEQITPEQIGEYTSAQEIQDYLAKYGA